MADSTSILTTNQGHPTQMVVAVSLAFDHDLLERALAIAPLRSSVVQLAQVAVGNQNGTKEVASVLNLDQGLLGTVLSEANSANQASRRTIGTADDAVMRLGVARVVALAMSDSVGAMLETAVPEYGLEDGELAFHSQLTSIAAEQLRRATGRLLPGELVTASLLHDIGKLVMGPEIGKAGSVSLNQARSSGQDWATAEHEILGVEHGEVGRIILDFWGLPEEIGLAVQYHHSPHLGGGLLAHGLALTDALAHAVLEEGGFEHLVDDPHALDSAAELRLDPARTEKLLGEVERTWMDRTGR